MDYSEASKEAVPALYNFYNDIDVYVEDETYRNAYEIFLPRILNGKARLRKVFPGKGRKYVIQKCKKSKSKRPSLFIIDGDLDLILNNDAPEIDKLYRLNVYTMENLLACADAAIELAFESSTDTTKYKIKCDIGFSRWRGYVCSKLRNLYVIYAVAYKLNASVRTTSKKVLGFSEVIGRNTRISDIKIKAEVNSIKRKLENEYTVRIVRETERQVRANLPRSATQFFKLLSGKTCCLPLLFKLLKEKTGFDGNMTTFPTRLARHCRTDIDPGLKVALLNAISQEST